MKINILASLGKLPGGANRNFLEFADQLVKRGHQVTIIKAVNRGEYQGRKKNIKGRIKEVLFLLSGSRSRPYRVDWLHSGARIIAVPAYRESCLPDADITLFSFPRVREKLARYSARTGRKVLRVASIWFAQNPPEVSENIILLATSTLVKDLLEKRFPGRRIYLLHNGVNPELFANPAKSFRKAETVGMLFYQKRPEHKGLDDAVAAFEIVRRKYPQMKFRAAGFKRERWLPAWIEFTDGRNQKDLAAFYSALDIFVFPSRADASPNPPLEAMACQAALVMTEVGGLNDYLIPGRTGLVSPTANPEALAANIVSLIENPLLLKEISLAGYRKAQEFSYQIQAGKMEALFQAIMK